MEGILITLLRTVISFMILAVVTFIIGKHINSHKNHYSFLPFLLPSVPQSPIWASIRTFALLRCSFHFGL